MCSRKIAIVGTGRAGRARLSVIDSRRDLESVQLSVRSPNFSETFQRVLQDTSVFGVVICAENAKHFDLAKMALKSGKHTLVEFPLCHTSAQARILYDLAAKQQRVLHVEFIGLMTGNHLAALAQMPGQAAKAHIDMSGGYYRWVRSDFEEGFVGSPYWSLVQAYINSLVNSSCAGYRHFETRGRLSASQSCKPKRCSTEYGR